LRQILRGPPISGQAEGQPDQARPARHRKRGEVLAVVAADDVGDDSELITRIGHDRLHIS